MDFPTALVSALIVAIVGGGFAALLNHRLSSRRERQTVKRKAAAKFRASVLDILNGLYPLSAKWPDDINTPLREAFPNLQKAVAEFRPHIPLLRRRAFDRAWFNYRCGTGREIDVQNYFHYMAFGDNPDAMGNFRRNVDSLLRFADI